MKLPEYTQQVSPQAQIPTRGVDLPGAPPSGAQQLGVSIAGLGEAVGELGKTYAIIEAKRRAAESDIEAANILAEYDQKTGISLQTLSSTKDNPDEFLVYANASLGSQAFIAKNQATSEEARQKVAVHLPLRIANSTLNVNRAYHGKVASWNTARAYLASAAETDLAVKAPTQEESLFHQENAIRALDSLSLFKGTSEMIAAQMKVQSQIREKRMDFLRMSDRKQLWELDRQGAFTEVEPIPRLKILEQARTDQEQENAQKEKIFKQAQDIVEQKVSALANQGLWRDADIENALTGKDPFITPDKARQYKAINENPVSGDATTQVGVIMQNYNMGQRTQGRINQARKELNALIVDSAKRYPQVSKALDSLQSDEMGMRGVEAAELSAGIKRAEDRLKSELPPTLPGRIGQMQKNQQAADEAEVRNQIRGGKSPDKAVDDLLKRRQGEKDALPQPRKDVHELLR